MKKIAVVGGGITGLTAAFQLQQAGLNPLVFEKADRAGGVIRTEEHDGYRIEAGPNSLQESPEQVAALIQALGLEAEVVEANPAGKNRYVVRGGRLLPVPMSPLAFFRSHLISSQGKLRLLKEPFIAPAPADTDESLAAFVRRRLGREVLDYLVNPFVAGIYAGDPERLSIRHGLPRLFALEKEHGSLFRGMRAARRQRVAGVSPVHSGGSPETPRSPRLISFRQGLEVLPAELAKRLRGHLYLETTAESITEKDGRWELIASRYGRRLRDTYDAIVLALPAQALARLALTSGDDKNPALESLREIPHPPVTSVSLGFRRDQVRHPLDGFGMLVPEKENRQILGTLFPSTLFPDRAPEGEVLLTSFVGGTRQPDAANAQDDDLVRNVRDEVRSLLGVTGDPVFTSVHRWPQAIPQYEVGHGRFLERIHSFESSHAGLFVAGPVRDGISLGQCIASGCRHASRAETFLA